MNVNWKESFIEQYKPTKRVDSTKSRIREEMLMSQYIELSCIKCFSQYYIVFS